MGRIIELTVNDKTYKLEFNRDSLLEAYDSLESFKPGSSLSSNYKVIRKLVKSAFLKNHPSITDEEVSDIIYSLEDLEGFIEAIKEIIESSVDVLTKKKGNAHWVVK